MQSVIVESLFPASLKAREQRGQIICFSHLRWDFVFQRPQHLLTRAVKDYEVFFVEEPLFEPQIRSSLRVRKQPDGVVVIIPVLPEGLSTEEGNLMQRSLLSMYFSASRPRPRILWFYTPMAQTIARNIDADLIVYDCMDELSGFRGANRDIKKLEMELLQCADVVFTGGLSLYEAKKRLHSNIHAFPSSIDQAHFDKARDRSIDDPEDQRDIPHPRVGFFGVIDERMDLKLVHDLAAGRPDLQFVMVGPVVKIDESILPRLSNIHWLGQKRYDELPGYLAHWDAGFMPFAHNEATRYISPTKTPEFLAAGVPVVSTAIPDVVRTWGKSGLVAIADTSGDFSRVIDDLIVMDKADWLMRVDDRLETSSWSSTWKSMDQLIRKCAHQRKLRAASEPVPQTASGYSA